METFRGRIYKILDQDTKKIKIQKREYKLGLQLSITLPSLSGFCPYTMQTIAISERMTSNTTSHQLPVVEIQIEHLVGDIARHKPESRESIERREI